jgi:uncharacterized coiled-coil protein SlyX
MPEDRVTRLEEKCTFLERDLNELDGAVREIGDGLADLRGELRQLASVIDRLVREQAPGGPDL